MFWFSAQNNSVSPVYFPLVFLGVRETVQQLGVLCLQFKQTLQMVTLMEIFMKSLSYLDDRTLCYGWCCQMQQSIVVWLALKKF